MTDSTVYFARCKALAASAKQEAANTLHEFQAACALTFRNCDHDCALYTVNDKYQAMTQGILREWRSTDNWTSQRQAFADEIEQLARSIVAEAVPSVFSPQPVGSLDVERMGSKMSFIVQSKMVFLHVWQCRREALKFNEAFRRLSFAKFDFCIFSPIHIPLSSLVQHQGLYVSVTWLPPLLTNSPAQFCGLTTHLVERLKAVLGVAKTEELPVFEGADGRCYVMGAAEVMCHGLATRAGIDASDQARHELIESIKTGVPQPLAESLSRDRVPLAAADVVRVFEERGTSLPIQEVLMQGMLSRALHERGLNASFLFEVFSNSRLQSSVPAIQATIVQSFLSEMVGRALRSLLEAVICEVPVPASSTSEVQVIQRLVIANQALEKFLKNKEFMREHVMPVLRAKFNCPADFNIASSSLSLTAILAFVQKKLGVEMDSTGRQITRFAATSLYRTSMFAMPKVCVLVHNLSLLEANAEIAMYWDFSQTISSSSLRAQCYQARALLAAYLVKSNVFADYFASLHNSLEFMKLSDESSFFALSGLLCEVANTSALIHQISDEHLSVLDHGDALALPLLVERHRIIAKLLSATRFEEHAAPYFEVAVQGFARLFKFDSSAASSIYFDLLLFRFLNCLRGEGPLAVVRRGHFNTLRQAADLGADKSLRRSKTAAAFFLLATEASEKEEPEREASATLVQCTSPALELHMQIFGAEDARTTAMNYFHLLCLVHGSLTDSVRAANAAYIPEEMDAIVDRFRTCVAEMFAAEGEEREMIIRSEWCVATTGRLIAVMMRIGVWEGAVSVLKAAKARYDVADERGVGKDSLREPLELLDKANEAAYVIKHYFFRAFRKRWDSMIVLNETIHRSGVRAMEHLAARSLLQRAQGVLRTGWGMSWLACVERCGRFFIEHASTLGLQPLLAQQEQVHRLRVVDEQDAAALELVVRFERIGRYGIWLERGVSWAEATDVVHFFWRRKVEREQEAAHNKMMQKMELGFRGNIMIREMITRRELLFQAAARVMQRVLQGEMLLRVVPVLSLYFFSEEQNARTVVEEEWATAVEELRLKEKVFRVGALKVEARRRAAELKQRSKRANAGLASVEEQERQRRKESELKESREDWTHMTVRSATEHGVKFPTYSDAAAREHERKDDRAERDKAKTTTTPRRLPPMQQSQEKEKEGGKKQKVSYDVGVEEELGKEIRGLWLKTKGHHGHQQQQQQQQQHAEAHEHHQQQQQQEHVHQTSRSPQRARGKQRVEGDNGAEGRPLDAGAEDELGKEIRQLWLKTKGQHHNEQPQPHEQRGTPSPQRQPATTTTPRRLAPVQRSSPRLRQQRQQQQEHQQATAGATSPPASTAEIRRLWLKTKNLAPVKLSGHLLSHTSPQHK